MLKCMLCAVSFCFLFALVCPRAARCAEAQPGAESGSSVPPARQFARITRDKQSKKAFLVLEADGPWQVYAAPDQHAFDFSRPLLSGEGRGTYPLAAPERHCFFALKLGGKTLILAEKLLPMAGGYNFRDLGGIPTRDGRFTAWGKVIRSDSMGHLTPEDLEYLASLPLVTVVDFRTPDGVEKSPDRLPSTVKDHLLLPMSPGNLDPRNPDAVTTEQAWDEFMQEINRELVLVDTNIAVYRKLFALLQQEQNLPLLFHCAAGKDRTGLAAAYFLFALGVGKDEVLRDYMASAEHLKGKYDHLIAKKPDRAPLFTVKHAYLRSAIEAMEEKSGSIENYLVQVLGVDLEKMRGMFLQK